MQLLFINIQRLLLLQVCILFCYPASSDPNDSLKVTKPATIVRANYHFGKVLQTNRFVKGENASGEPYEQYHALGLEFGKQTDGSRLWERLYNYPVFGVGFYSLKFISGGDELGYPNAIYGFINAPFMRAKKWSLNWELGFGLSYNWEPYNRDLNPLNVAIGSYRNVYVDAGMSLAYWLSDRIVADAGFSLTHFSNGSSSIPNLGINMFAPKVSLRYQLRDRKLSFEKFNKPDFDPKNEFIIYVAAGTRNIKFDTTDTDLKTTYYDKNYLMGNISLAMNRQISHKSKFGVGVDVNYSGATEAEYFIETRDTIKQITTLDAISVALVGYYELVIGDLSVVVAPGYEVLRNDIEGKQERFYQKIGVRYYMFESRSLFGGISIRAVDFSVAHYIEWTVGYRLRQ